MFKIENMPSRSQFFPTEEIINMDKPITLNIVQCSKCGLVQLDNEPVSYYKEVIRATSVSSKMKKFRLHQLKTFIEKYKLYKKKGIEIGCGNCDYLDILNELDIEIYGIEFSEKNIKICKEKNLKVFKGFIENEIYKIPKKPYDIFFIFNYLEHIPNPIIFLKGIWNNLTENGIGIIEVPNFNMILKEKMLSEFTIDHLSYFTKNTLELTLKLSGFEILEINEIWNDYILSAIVRKRNLINVEDFDNFKTILKKNIDDFIKENNDFAIWGAGHQALAIIAMTNLNKKCKFIIDSASFKQNKYTPATHIKIVSPEYLRKHNVKSILIMAGSYSDEIAQILKKEYPDIKNYILKQNKIIRNN
ncbi:class I SAM-dependent methyltransferase [Tepiditoga spiralis]|uniref:class I SAM-dependent methyltransferase n=1 Tax=Tepiditoga spiralis TaxID=2108365 RepID=UPI001689E148|nr:class I SAM-dependent methyltransferase [Tepiditoga spiralis]